MKLFNRTPPQTISQEIAAYTASIAIESRELQRLQQVYILSQGNPQAFQDVETATITLRVMQEILAMLVDKARKAKDTPAQ